jgi:uncharacterized protein YbdZ (MbtH family)
MTLALIAISSIALAGMARHSMNRALEANREEKRLQLKWLRATATDSIVSSAAAALPIVPAQAGEVSTASLKSTRTQMNLPSGWSLSVTVSDESAKANLQTLLRFREPGKALAGELLRSHALLTQFLGSASESTKSRAIRNWGDVFEYPAGQSSVDTARSIRNATKEITCWGDGRINLERASSDLVQSVCQLVASDEVAREFVARLRAHGAKDLNKLTTGLEVNEGELQALRNIVSNQSRCYSLWLEINLQEQTWTTLHVLDKTAGDGGNLVFRW